MVNETTIKTANFIFFQKYRQTLGPIQSRIQWVSDFFLLGLRRSRLEFDLSPSSAEVKNRWK
jgi:hypothetical protein